MLAKETFEILVMKCDQCGLEFRWGNHRMFDTEEVVLGYASKKGWLVHADKKHYCPECAQNAEVVIAGHIKPREGTRG
jgi:hypothetical protein